jgi:copper chaperone
VGFFVAFQASKFSLDGVRKFRGETELSEGPGLVMILDNPLTVPLYKYPSLATLTPHHLQTSRAHLQTTSILELFRIPDNDYPHNGRGTGTGGTHIQVQRQHELRRMLGRRQPRPWQAGRCVVDIETPTSRWCAVSSLTGIAGVKSYDVSLDTQTATVHAEPSLDYETVLKTIKKTGKAVNSGEADGEARSVELEA